MRRRTVGLAVGALSVGVAALLVAPALGTPGPPMSIAALGGAISAGACTDAWCADRPANSWVTGTNPAVRSHRLRLRALVSGIRGPASERFRRPVRAFTFATSRFRTVIDLEAQARQANAHRVALVTVDLGVGDLCARTSLRTFRVELEKVLTLLSWREFPRGDLREVLVPSIEDLSRHWQVLRADPVAARALKAGRHLDCGLGYSVSRARLGQIRKRAIAMNEVIARVCFRIRCLYDAGRRFRMPLKASYFSAADPRYLSIEGQRALARVEWKPALALISAYS